MPILFPYHDFPFREMMMRPVLAFHRFLSRPTLEFEVELVTPSVEMESEETTQSKLRDCDCCISAGGTSGGSGIPGQVAVHTGSRRILILSTPVLRHTCTADPSPRKITADFCCMVRQAPNSEMVGHFVSGISGAGQDNFSRLAPVLM